MPTAAKLAAAIVFAALAFVASEIAKTLMPANTPAGWLSEINAAISALVGWFLAGRRTGIHRTVSGIGWRGALERGLTGTVAALVLVLLFHATARMITQSLRRRYDNPGEAVLAVVELMIDYLRMIATAEMAVTLLCGGLLAGLVVEQVSRRWR